MHKSKALSLFDEFLRMVFAALVALDVALASYVLLEELLP